MAHFVELPDETLDWQKYYTVGLPKDISDERWRQEIGHRGWYLIHGAIDNYPCSLCRVPGSKLINGVHEVVNVFTEKRDLRHMQDLLFLQQQTNLAVQKAQQLNLPRVRHVSAAPMVVRHG